MLIREMIVLYRKNNKKPINTKANAQFFNVEAGGT
jgi:hypothetical protein